MDDNIVLNVNQILEKTRFQPPTETGETSILVSP